MDTEPGLFRSARIGLLISSCLLSLGLRATPADAELELRVDYVMAFAEDEVRERLELLDQSLLEHRLDKAVRNYIARHLRYPRQTARNLGRAVAYFPIFEAELAAAGLPETLKYLPIIESALVPRALSRVGAEGLWQFMPETAPEYGLRIDDKVDERLDTYRATQAAIRYLKSAHEYLGDWSLAIAAYNAGKGRVRRAQRRSGGKNFWAVRRYLPRESRHYVPAFIAAVYLTEFYAAHGIEPEFPELDRQLIERMVVHRPLSFYRIAQVTGLSIDFIESLNPAYLKGYLPGYSGGHYLILPQRVAPALRDYLATYTKEEDEPVLPWAPIFRLPESTSADAGDYRSLKAIVAPGDSLASLAARLECTPSQLAIWNRFSPLDTLVEGQTLLYFRPVRFQTLPTREVRVGTWRAPRPRAAALESMRYARSATLPRYFRVQPTVMLRRRTRPDEILARYPMLNADDFHQINGTKGKRSWPAGTLLKLPY